MRSAPIIILLVTGAASCVADAHSETTPRPPPTSLEECYLRVASEKADADMAYVAREICDSVFRPARRSLFLLDEKTGGCVEWWLDRRGRYESHHVYCALEPAGAGKWTLACQYKDRATRHTLVEFGEEGDRYVRSGKLVGVDPGPMFKSMAACIRHKIGR